MNFFKPTLVSAACLSVLLGLTSTAAMACAKPPSGNQAGMPISKSSTPSTNTTEKQTLIKPETLDKNLKTPIPTASITSVNIDKDNKASEQKFKEWIQAITTAKTHKQHDMAFKTPEQRRTERLNRLMVADVDKNNQLSKNEIETANMKGIIKQFEDIDNNKDAQLNTEELLNYFDKRELDLSKLQSNQPKPLGVSTGTVINNNTNNNLNPVKP